MRYPAVYPPACRLLSVHLIFVSITAYNFHPWERSLAYLPGRSARILGFQERYQVRLSCEEIKMGILISLMAGNDGGSEWEIKEMWEEAEEE
ncbi:hypothetical protein E2C01_088138 [Portunus trituberculatus]|uniref:Uncharacterized protein n=1 Tax=Portunus trituberculatus TaxID=210409 RepID=A0A5B7JF56_PORTR|nr:hypothetical protein [Portunus trituberculatus]